MTLTGTLRDEIKNTSAACAAMGVARATFQRRQKPKTEPRPRPAPPLALSDYERERVLSVLHSERFQDAAPHQVYATLLDEGVYHCSIRTMYRLLAQHNEVRERRNITWRKNNTRPELLAKGPNQVWSWDITKLLGPAKWTYFYLYVIMDIFSRYVVGWMVAHQELAALATRLIAESCSRQSIQEGQLTIHADRGTSMTSKPVAFLLADLGVTKTHSRPYVSNDNPYSESQFKTLKYRPEFPDRFGGIEDARAFCCPFFDWYNNEHRHTGIGMFTPAQVHHGQAAVAHAQRATVLEAAFSATPKRFKGKMPKPASIPKEVWINPPKEEKNLH